MRPRTGRHTDAGDHNTLRVVYDSREMKSVAVGTVDGASDGTVAVW